MNISQGLYRLAQVIKWVGRIAGGLWFLGVSFFFLNSPRQADIRGDAILFLCAALIFIAVTEGVAWVLEGFADD